MTTTIEEATENKNESTACNLEKCVSSSRQDLPKEIMDIMEYLSCNSNIVFKSQQRDEPELKNAEKLKMALDVYQRNPQTFLIRFGNYLEESHLQNFARLSIADSDEEMHQMIKDYQHKLKTRKRDIKNRRYTALQKLIKEGEYFTEQEMMKRQPELYQELVGQYLTKKEKEKRDSYDVRNTTFSGILMHNLEQKQLNEIMEKTENDALNSKVKETLLNSSTDDIVKDDILNGLDHEDDDVPLNCRQQWGNFDNEEIACSTSKSPTKKKFTNEVKPNPTIDLIMADERELLRQEFISQMHEQFLTGQDKDFDYDSVDNNTQYDDLNLINQDEEDKYFEESDEDDGIQIQEKEDLNILSQNKMEEDEESEDDLDAYMSHLSKHHSLQVNNRNIP